MPNEIVADNAKNFGNDLFREYCHNLGTKVERANGIVFTAIKKTLLDQKKGKWEEELPKVVWSHNTTESRALSSCLSGCYMERKQ